MTDILDEHLLDTKGNLDLDKIDFYGKLAGRKWKYQQTISSLVTIRRIMIFMGLLILYPIVSSFFVRGIFELETFLLRVFFSFFLFLGAILFNKFRIVSVIIALIGLSLLIIAYLYSGFSIFNMRILFNIIFSGIIASGIFFHFREKQLKNELLLEFMNKNPEAKLIQ